LPLTRAAVPSPSVKTAAERAAERFKGARILAAEDNPVNQLVLKTILLQADIEPTIVGDGMEALAAWDAGDWSLLLMDVQMPVLDGLAACREIRRREAASGRRRTPIIALTANAMTHHQAEYVAAGMDGFLAKPIDVAHLFSAIEAALGPAEAARASALASLRG
jgi:CheY-like chemotaxis protein